MENLRQRLLGGDTLLGCFLNLGSSLTTEIVGKAGFDFVVIDLEHGAGSESDVTAQLQALVHTNTAAVIRVESHERQRAHRVLDAGAHGIMFPRVNNAEEAQNTVAALRYPPQGVRGVAAMNRACDFGVAFRSYVDSANSSLLGVLQIESEEAVRNVDEIAAVDGADVLFIGPLDLTVSLGIIQQLDHPRFVEAVEKTAAAARKHGKALGILMPKAEDFTRFFDFGCRFIACNSDGGLLTGAARALSQSLVSQRAEKLAKGSQPTTAKHL
jgi:4-hydroxy-2-oxoheptanedioate aldolase